MQTALTHRLPLLNQHFTMVLAGFLVAVSCIHGFNTTAQAEGKIHVRSGKQVYEPFAGKSQFSGGVQVAMDDTKVTGGAASIQTDASGTPQMAVFNANTKMVRTMGSLKQTIQADSLKMGLQSNSFEARGGVKTNMSGDSQMGNIAIQSDTQVFDQDRHVMKASGGVTVRKDDITATSPEALIFMSASGQAEKAVFIKGARLIQGEQQLQGETITINIKTGDIFAENRTKSLVIGKDSAGKPTRVTIESHLQEMDKATGLLIANGNALIHYDDYIAKGPKAVFYRKNGQLDRIVLTGRAQVEDAERKVMGDTVTITINPKQFNAKGNVATMIKAKQQTSSTPTATSNTKKPTSTANKTKTRPSIDTRSTKSRVEAHNQAWDEEQMIEDSRKGNP